jgi:bifunctional ADP-heptose synthase (sugar kinase/adenylyltransferase)
VDTRTKILTAAVARRIASPVVVATGFFDVLRAEHVRELRELRKGGALLVVVLPFAGELLDQRSRAELVAGLRMVDYVVAADHGDVDALIDALKPVQLARLEVADARRARQLIDHVQRRQTL